MYSLAYLLPLNKAWRLSNFDQTLTGKQNLELRIMKHIGKMKSNNGMYILYFVFIVVSSPSFKEHSANYTDSHCYNNFYFED